MPSVDEQLRRTLRRAAPRPTTADLDHHLARRRRRAAVRRRVATVALTVSVLAGTAGGFVALSDAFETERPLDTSPTMVPPSPSLAAATHIDGVPFAVCRVSMVTGHFGEGLDTAWVFEEEHKPGWGCDGSEGFQHLAVGSDGRVDILTGRITDVVSEDAWHAWAFAAPDLDDDGTDEIAIARQGGEPDARHLWFLRPVDGEIVPIIERCRSACVPVPWNVEIGPVEHESGVVTDAGLTCGIPGGRAEDREALISWQANPQDPLHVHLEKWRLEGATLEHIGAGELILDGTPGAFPPSGLDDLCGSPTTRAVNFPLYIQTPDLQSSSIETPWFVAPVPEGWSGVTADSLRIGRATFAAQLTNVPVDEPICLGGGSSLPSDAVLLRLSVGWETGWESNLMLPSLEPALADVPNGRPFVDDCGAATRELAVFFGPDGHQLGAHVLIGPAASSGDVEEMRSILEGLSASRGPLVEVPGATRAVVRGTDPDIGDWAVTFRRDFGGAVVALREGRSSDGFGFLLERPTARPLEIAVRALDDRQQVLVLGVVGADARRVEVQLDDGRIFDATLVPFDERDFMGQVFWIPPVDGSILAEGTKIEPSGVVVVSYPRGDRESRPVPG